MKKKKAKPRAKVKPTKERSIRSLNSEICLMRSAILTYAKQNRILEEKVQVARNLVNIVLVDYAVNKIQNAASRYVEYAFEKLNSKE